MAMYLCRTLGGHKLIEIGKALGLEKYSSVSSACLSMKGRIENEKRLARRAHNVERFLKSQRQTFQGKMYSDPDSPDSPPLWRKMLPANPTPHAAEREAPCRFKRQWA